MIKLIKEQATILTLMHNDCTFEQSEVQFVVLKFITPYKVSLVLDANTSPSVNNFIDKDKTILWNININQLTSSINARFMPGVYEMDYFIGLKTNKVITGVTEGNLVNGINILASFANTSYITFSNDYTKIYEIDKAKSTTNVLFLKKPISFASNLAVNTPVFPVVKVKEYLCVVMPIKKEINTLIMQSRVNSSNEELTQLTNDVILLMAIKNAVNLNDFEGTNLLYNNLNNRYKC